MEDEKKTPPPLPPAQVIKTLPVSLQELQNPTKSVLKMLNEKGIPFLTRYSQQKERILFEGNKSSYSKNTDK